MAKFQKLELHKNVASFEAVRIVINLISDFLHSNGQKAMQESTSLPSSSEI